MKFAGSESLPRVEHFACDGFPSGMEHFHIRWIPFPAGVFCMRQVYLLPAGAFRMRQLRGGEAFIVAKAIFPPRAPPLRPRSFIVRCGDVCMYWWGDGFYGAGNVTLRRFTPKSKAQHLDSTSPVRPQGNSAFRPGHPAQR